jgi:hypothetical protein
MKLSLVILIISLASISICSCGSKSLYEEKSNFAVSLPEITSESEEGFYDLVLAITEHRKLADGAQTILASGLYKGSKVSLEIYLHPSWQSRPFDADVPLTTYRGNLSIRSIGAESDLLLRAIDEIYGTKQSPKAMNKATEFTGICLGGNPQELSKEIVKIKSFFDSNSANEYAEFFTNIDLNARKVYIREKDEEYRAAIVRALKAP